MPEDESPLTTTGNAAYRRSQADGYLNDLSAAVEELGRPRWALRWPMTRPS